MDNDLKELKRLNREQIHGIWEIAKSGQLNLLPEEKKKYAEVMLEHKEQYFNQFEVADLTYDHDYDPDSEENPFLHIALHVTVENQLEAKEPIEVYQFYNSMRKRRLSHHETVHLVAAVLAPLIFAALQQRKTPDLDLYKSLLKKYKGKRPEKIWALMDSHLGPLFR